MDLGWTATTATTDFSMLPDLGLNITDSFTLPGDSTSIESVLLADFDSTCNLFTKWAADLEPSPKLFAIYYNNNNDRIPLVLDELYNQKHIPDHKFLSTILLWLCLQDLYPIIPQLILQINATPDLTLSITDNMTEPTLP